MGPDAGYEASYGNVVRISQVEDKDSAAIPAVKEMPLALLCGLS